MNNIKILSVKFLNNTRKSQRRIKVKISSGATITIEANNHGSYQQFGGTNGEEATTKPIAEKFLYWIQGEEIAC